MTGSFILSQPLCLEVGYSCAPHFRRYIVKGDYKRLLHQIGLYGQLHDAGGKMKMKLFFLLIIVTGTVQELFCGPYPAAVARTTVICCSCGCLLVADEIDFNVSLCRSKNQFMCQRCHTRAKDEDQEAVQLTEETFQPALASSTSPSLSSHFFNASDASCSDHFYEDKEVRKLVEEASWDLFPDDVKKLRKVIVGRHKKTCKVVKKQKSKKGTTALYSDLGVRSPISVFPLSHNLWLYMFPQSEMGPYLQLQVVYGDQVFTSSSKTPAQELWCQGPRSVVVTEDGYTYFDIQKNERLFFRKKEDLAAHMAIQGFDSEFKVLLKDASPVVNVSAGKDPEFERIFGDFRKTMDESFKSYHAKDRELDEHYAAQVKEIVSKFETMTAS